eukprot:3665830-Rhodomonas_salina.1
MHVCGTGRACAVPRERIMHVCGTERAYRLRLLFSKNWQNRDEGQLSAYARAMRCPVLTYRTVCCSICLYRLSKCLEHPGIDTIDRCLLAWCGQAPT